MVIDSMTMMTEMNDNADVCTPDSLVILSFTNKDAKRLKDRALDCLFSNTNGGGGDDTVHSKVVAPSPQGFCCAFFFFINE